MGRVAVPKGAHSTVYRPVRHRFGAGLPHGDGSGEPVGRGAVPKSGQKNALARDNLYPDGTALFPCAREHTPLGVFRCPLPSIFMKFTWHANPYYRYL